MIDFLTATEITAIGPRKYRAEAHGYWAQGRTLFGGVVAAIGLRALRAEVGEGERPVRSVHVDFVAPVEVGSVAVDAEILRAGGSISHGRALLSQRDQVLAQVTATFGSARESTVRVAPPVRPERPLPGEVVELPYIDGVTPSFTRNFGFRFTDGAVPFTGGSEKVIGGWCCHRGPCGEVAEATLGLVDAWPSPVLGMLQRPAPASTVTWTTSFVDPPPTCEVDSWWWYFCDTVSAADGYASIRGLLYAPSGRLAAEFEQLVAIFG